MPILIEYMRSAVLGLAALALLATPAAAQSTQFKASSVSLAIPAGIGGGYDMYGRLVARHLGRFLPGNPAIVPRNQPGAGGVVVGNYLANSAPKDGSAIALFMAGTSFEPLFGNSQARYEPTKLNWIISLNELVNIGIFWHTTAVKTPDDFFNRDVPVASSGGGDASTDVMPKLLNNLAGTRFKVVTGYSGNGEGMLAMERGEVDGIVGTELSSFRATRPQWLRDGTARIVIQIVLHKSPELPDVPSALDLIKDQQSHEVFALLLARQQNGRPFALPQGTPPEIVATFRQAFAAMAKDPAFLQDAANLKADIVVSSGEEITALLDQTYSTPKPLLERAIAEFKKAGGR
jgi:tripartite-type tricarboxylate transporter receptor subunit TctC